MTIPLVIGFRRSLSRLKDPEGDRKDAEFERLRTVVLERAGYRCAGCGFQSSSTQGGYLELHHLDDDHDNNSGKNHAALCPFCHQVFHCGLMGGRECGRIAYLPEISQAALNLTINAAASMRHHLSGNIDALNEILNIDKNNNRKNDVDQKKKESALESCLRMRDACVGIIELMRAGEIRMDHLYGEGASSALAFSEILGEIAENDPKRYAKREEFLAPFRLIPNVASFEQQLTYWGENVWGRLWKNVPAKTN